MNKFFKYLSKIKWPSRKNTIVEKTIDVEGYRTKNGTWVAPHKRRLPAKDRK